VRFLFLQFLKDESAATAIEYALVAAGIALAIVTAVSSLGTAVKGQYTAISTSLK
jgi:pilus assembly protein Flp/PilA